MIDEALREAVKRMPMDQVELYAATELKRRQTISSVRTGAKASPETRAKISAALKRSHEQRRALKAAMA